MIVKVKMNISSSEYFDFITEHLLDELPKSMKKKIQPSDIKKGLKYRQTYKLKSGDFVSKKEIVEFEYGKVYRLQMEVPDGFQYIGHTINPISDDQIEVVYEETVESSKSTTSLFHKLKSNSNKKQMKQRLKAIEEHIISKREPEEDAEEE